MAHVKYTSARPGRGAETGTSGAAAGGARWDGVRCPQELVSSVLASSCAAAGRGGVAPLLSAEPGSGGGAGPPAAAAPLGAAQPLQRRGPWARPLLESPGAEQRRGSSGSSGGDGRGPGARGLRLGMDGAPCFLSRKELRG
ncbi:unnamed protein product [Miscanthus lutarioriparius]|uniref:Uncharacterized protein n=1 Tax=Miscanthus lutarioriparius TaxID=422564 RepID=A0A811NUC8_9POAL|nr:unnamed protein product [Miscanthus lutarioriparius]